MSTDWINFLAVDWIGFWHWSPYSFSAVCPGTLIDSGVSRFDLLKQVCTDEPLDSDYLLGSRLAD